MPDAKVKIDRAAVNRMANRRGGPVMDDMEKRARKVQRVARRTAPGRMGRKVTARVVTRGSKRIVVVECDHPAALFVIKGTRPHVIRPVRRKVLRFKVEGKTVFARRVKHPGTRPNNFMAEALRSAVR